MIFETHAHYDDEAFDDDRAEVLQMIQEAGVSRAVNVGADMASSRRSIELAKANQFMYAAVGVHPDSAGELNEESYAELDRMCSEPKVVAVGEIGLDYHWDKWPRDLQKETFLKQWEMAIEHSLPVIIHSRDAAADTMELIREMYRKERVAGRELRAVLHCYGYSADQAAEYLDMGLYFGIGGVVTFKNARKLHEVVQILPENRILLETDCPYLAPEPFRGKRNCSAYIPYAAEKLAELKEIDKEYIYENAYANAQRFFGIE